MRRPETLCYLCVYPHALDYCKSRARPPSYVEGSIAVRRLTCTRCGSEIPVGQGYVRVHGDADAGQSRRHAGRGDNRRIQDQTAASVAIRRPGRLDFMPLRK